eukprot:3162192-Pyramimonas_sp.AAC.1
MLKWAMSGLSQPSEVGYRCPERRGVIRCLRRAGSAPLAQICTSVEPPAAPAAPLLRWVRSDRIRPAIPS